MSRNYQNAKDYCRFWLFGLKVMLMFGIIYMIGMIPLGVIYWLMVLLAGDVLDSPVGGVMQAVFWLVWIPAAIGWMMHNAPDWFTMNHDRPQSQSISGAD